MRHNLYSWHLYWIGIVSILEGICSLQKDVHKVICNCYDATSSKTHYHLCILCILILEWITQAMLSTEYQPDSYRMTYDKNLWPYLWAVILTMLIKLGHSTLNVGGAIPGACVLGCMKRRELSNSFHLFSDTMKSPLARSCPWLPTHSGLNLWIMSWNKNFLMLLWVGYFVTTCKISKTPPFP